MAVCSHRQASFITLVRICLKGESSPSPRALVLIRQHGPRCACRTIQLGKKHLITIKTEDPRPKSIINHHQGLLYGSGGLGVPNIFQEVTHSFSELLEVNEISLVCLSSKNGARHN